MCFFLSPTRAPPNKPAQASPGSQGQQGQGLHTHRHCSPGFCGHSLLGTQSLTRCLRQLRASTVLLRNWGPPDLQRLRRLALAPGRSSLPTLNLGDAVWVGLLFAIDYEPDSAKLEVNL